MKRLSTQQMALMAFCVVLGLLTKRIISPITNTLTDFFRIPGGSAAVGFSLAFLLIGRETASMRAAGTLMGLIQGILALMLGFSGYQGIFAIITYTLPGVMVDLTAALMKTRDTLYFLAASVLACVVSSLVTSLLVFHLTGIALTLWLLLAACSGMAGGLCAQLLYSRIRKIIRFEATPQRAK